MIRAAHAGDVPALRTLQRAAGARFRDAGMAAVADLEPISAERLSEAARNGLLWVATDAGDRPVGFLLASLGPGRAHVEQVSVDPVVGGRGIGAGLIEHLSDWAAGRGLGELTLTTFADVPWNAPYYRRLGFRAVPPAELTGEQRARARANATGPLGAWPRVTMRRAVPEAVR
jgi:GNAT superfamily N-acetyltransferase